jgi:hypothetical protein
MNQDHTVLFRHEGLFEEILSGEYEVLWRPWESKDDYCWIERECTILSSIDGTSLVLFPDSANASIRNLEFHTDRGSKKISGTRSLNGSSSNINLCPC